MPITATCQCGKKYTFKDQFAGRRAKCPACGQVVQIPGLRAGGRVLVKQEPAAPETASSGQPGQTKTPASRGPRDSARWSARLLGYRPSSLGRRIGSVFLLYLGPGLLFGLCLGAPELLLGGYPIEVKITHGTLILLGAFVALALTGWGVWLWWRWPLASGIGCSLQTIAAFLALGSETSSVPAAKPIQYAVCVVVFLAGLLFLVLGIWQFWQTGQQTDAEKQTAPG